MRRGEAGFALIEILIAVALLGLIATMIGGAVGNAARLNVAGEARLADQTRIENVQALLRRQLEGALPLPSAGSSDGEALAFAGGPSALAIATRRPARLLQGGLYFARFSFDPPSSLGKGGRLSAAWQLLDPARPLAEQQGRIETVDLLDDIAVLNLRYFGVKASGAAGWHADWAGEPSLPALISIALEPSAGAGWRWPPLVVAPRIAALAKSPASKRPPAQ
jgi:general secretion pathway protein J